MKKAFLLALLAITLNLSAQSTTYFAKPLELNSVPVSTSKSDSVVVWSNKILKHVPRSEFVGETPSFKKVLESGSSAVLNQKDFRVDNHIGPYDYTRIQSTYSFIRLFGLIDQNSGQFDIDNGKVSLKQTTLDGATTLQFTEPTTETILKLPAKPYREGSNEYTLATTSDIEDSKQTLDEVLAAGNEAIGKEFILNGSNGSKSYFSPTIVNIFNQDDNYSIVLNSNGVSSTFLDQSRGTRLQNTGVNFFDYRSSNSFNSTIVPNIESRGSSQLKMPLMLQGDQKTIATTSDILPTPNLQQVLNKGNLAVLDEVSTVLLGGDVEKERVVAFFMSNGEEENFKRGFLVIENGKATIGANKTGARADISFDDSKVLISEAIGQNRTNVKFKTPLASGVNLFFPAPNTVNTDYTLATTDDIKLKSYTVSTLPIGAIGDQAYVTDATTPTYLGGLTGGGSVVCPVFYNGSTWVAH